MPRRLTRDVDEIVGELLGVVRDPMEAARRWIDAQLDGKVPMYEAARLLRVNPATLRGSTMKKGKDGRQPLEGSRTVGGQRFTSLRHVIAFFEERYTGLFPAELEERLEWLGGEIVTMSQAAEIVGCSTYCLRQLTDKGRLPAIWYPGGQRRFRRSDLEKLLDNPELHDLIAP